MTRTDFTELVLKPTLARIALLSASKGDEYARNRGAFINFKLAADSSRTPTNPIQALEGMKLKHDISFRDMLDAYDKHFETLKQGSMFATEDVPTLDYIDDKLNDILVYTILMKGMLHEFYGQTDFLRGMYGVKDDKMHIASQANPFK